MALHYFQLGSALGSTCTLKKKVPQSKDAEYEKVFD